VSLLCATCNTVSTETVITAIPNTLIQLELISRHMEYKPASDPCCGYLSPSPQPAPSPYVSTANWTVDPNVTTFAEMTNLIDFFRTTRFLPLYQQSQNCYPPLTPQESKTLNDIAVGINQFDRSRSLNGRGGWAFNAIANEHDAWVAEILLTMGMGTRVYCGFPYTSDDVTRAYGFLHELQKRILPF